MVIEDCLQVILQECILLANNARRLFKCLSENNTIIHAFGSYLDRTQTIFSSGWVYLHSHFSVIKLCTRVILMECGL